MIKRFIWTFVLFSLNKNLTIDCGSKSDILKLGKEYCPVNDFCTLNRTSAVQGSCCAECNCDELCLRTKTCCPDASDRWDEVKPASVETSCENGYYINDYVRLKDDQKIFYHMRTFCSDGRPCEIPDGNSTESFDDIVAVFDNTTDTLYRNKRCAECNGVYDYARWSLFLIKCATKDIMKYIRQKDFDETLSYMLHSCVMVSVPPDLNTRPYTCHRDTYISMCNTTKQWDVFDEELQTACLNPYTVAPYITPLESVAYKNVFCFLCNSPPDVPVRMLECSMGSKDILTDFSRLLSVDFSAKLPTKPPGDDIVTACKTYQMFDVFHNVCRTVNCYDYKVPSYGQCITGPVRYEMRTSIDVQFGFYPIQNRILINDTLAFHKNVHILELLESKLNISHCLNCLGPRFPERMKVYLDETKQYVRYFVAELLILLSPDCSHQYIFAAVHKLVKEKTTIPVFVNNESFDFIIERSQSNKYNNTPIIDTILPSQCGTDDVIKHFTGQARVTLSPLECPYVILNEIEFCKLVYIYMQTHNIQSVGNTICPMIFGAVIFPEYYVCVETFQQVRALRTHQSGSQSSKGVVSLITTCVSMFCIICSVGIYLYLNKFRSAPMYVLFSALGNLFIAQGVFQFGSGWSEYKRICEVMGIAVHYFWLSSMFAMNAYCVIVMRNLQTLRSSDTPRKTISVAFAYIYGLPLCFVMQNMIYATFTHAQNEFMSGYGASSCHIDNNLMRGLLFSLPIFLTVIVNCFVYAVTVYRIRHVASAVARNRKSTHYGIVYFRLLLSSGVTWLIGFVNQFVNVGILDYLFIVCAAGQGIFLLISILLSGTIRRDIGQAMARTLTNSYTTGTSSTLRS